MVRKRGLFQPIQQGNDGYRHEYCYAEVPYIQNSNLDTAARNVTWSPIHVCLIQLGARGWSGVETYCDAGIPALVRTHGAVVRLENDVLVMVPNEYAESSGCLWGSRPTQVSQTGFASPPGG